jgi:hypothetical protein
MTPQEAADRLFVGISPCGISYADRMTEDHRDYKRLAFLPYATLELEVRKRCHPAPLQQISEHAAEMQVKGGQEFQISTCGQTVLLGAALPR